MVLSVTAQLFYKAADDTEKLGYNNPKWLEQAASLMVSIAKRYAAAEIGLDELYAVRDAWMKDHGIPLRTPAMGLRKRPASCTVEWSAPLTRVRTKTPPSVGAADAEEGTEEEDAGAKESEAGSSEVDDGETFDKGLGGAGIAAECGAARGAGKLATMKRPAGAPRAFAGADTTGSASKAMSATVRQSSNSHGDEMPTSQWVRGAALEQFVCIQPF